MLRPAICWDNRALRLIMGGLERCGRQFSRTNARFIDSVHTVTERLYGVGTYVRLLRGAGPMLEVTRRSSNTII